MNDIAKSLAHLHFIDLKGDCCTEQLVGHHLDLLDGDVLVHVEDSPVGARERVFVVQRVTMRMLDADEHGDEGRTVVQFIELHEEISTDQRADQVAREIYERAPTSSGVPQIDRAELREAYLRGFADGAE